MTVLTVRYQVREDSVAEVEALIEKAFAAIEAEQPAGIRYAMGKLPDGVTFLGVLELEDGIENPLPAMAAGRELQQSLPGLIVGEPPVPQPVQVLGSYRLFA